MLKPTTLAELVSRISYKPGWTFELRQDRIIEDYAWLEIKAQVRDSRNLEQTVEFVMKRTVPEYLTTPSMFLKWVAYTLREAEIHEMREFFRFDGELVDDPHAVAVV